MPHLQFSFQNVSRLDDVPQRRQFERWVLAALRIDTMLNIRIVDLEEGRALNSFYRGKDYATNVLTFPLSEEPVLMGDIIICAPVVRQESMEQGKPLLAHYAHMTVHGVLHLHGYDHEHDAQAALMESIEVAILQGLRFPDPYAE